MHVKGKEDEMEIISKIKFHFKTFFNHEPIEIVIGHEHGNQSKKCFLQVCLFFTELIQNQFSYLNFVGPTNFKYEVFFIETTSAKAARTYANQDGLVVWKADNKEGYLGVHSSMSPSEFSDHMRRHNIRDLVHNGDRMVNNLITYVHDRVCDPFGWRWPLI